MKQTNKQNKTTTKKQKQKTTTTTKNNNNKQTNKKNNNKTTTNQINLSSAKIQYHRFRLNIYTRWCIRVDDKLGVYTPNSPFYDKEKIKTRVSNNAHAQGVGRHTDEEVGEMIRHDLTMLSEILGEGAFSI